MEYPKNSESSERTLRWINGVRMPNKFARYVDLVYNWNVRDEDVWIVTYPKSGTTWTQEMVWLIMNDLDFDRAKEDLDIRSPFFELSGVHVPKEYCKDAHLFYKNSFEYVKELCKNGPVCIKTHLPWSILPKGIQENRKKPKIIYVSRNPKDVAVSRYYHNVLFHCYEGGIEEIFTAFLEGTDAWGPYWNHVLPFWRRCKEPNILFLTYEEMVKNLPDVIRRVSNFLGKTLSSEQVETLSDHLSFSKMKSNKAVSKDLFLKYHIPPGKLNGTFIRSGKTDSHKQEMSQEFIHKFDEWIQQNTAGTDYVI